MSSTHHAVSCMHDHAEVHHAKWSSRAVTLVCGPPGSGKSTLARQLHVNALELEQFEGDPRTRMKLYGRAAYRIGRNPMANVGVVRGAPGVVEREHHEQLCRPSLTVVLLTPADICHERIDARGRATADGEHFEVDRWWSVWRAENPPTDNPWGF